jgi:preprotein translocase subunit SecF
MKRYKIKKDLILGVFLFLVLTSIIGCGARKTHKEKEKTKTESVIVSNEKVNADSTDNTKKDVFIVKSESGTVLKEVITVTPIDPNKEATVKNADGNVVKVNNAIYKIERMIANNNYELKKETKEQKAVSVKTNKNASFEKHEKEAKYVELKVSDKKQFNYSYLLLLIIPLVIGVYLFYKYNPSVKLFNFLKK